MIVLTVMLLILIIWIEIMIVIVIVIVIVMVTVVAIINNYSSNGGSSNSNARLLARAVRLHAYAQSPYQHCGFQRAWLNHNLNLKGWDSHVHRGFPGKFDSSNVSGDNICRGIGRIPQTNVSASASSGSICDIIYYTILYYTILYCTVLYYTIL